ncbi:HypC/HybG/HupF family hydrogenase formation chaperone [Rahnella sp. AA]|uniref:hydrogenase maturation factor HybG n=1 Tax=Rahnella sp. AA TaxID=2057180 RepID=UPI000C34AB7A|nr:hydrogenase maturation factor HybG [Rahnella sp. AA]PKE31920.1 HypC/HybG/HupF family hydrogenase formation chaperone [Rahnella sp. AA]
MCIGIPGKVVSVGEDIHQPAIVDISGLRREVNIALVCEGETLDLIGRWVLVHVGFAMSLLDEEEAQDTLAALQSMQLVEQELDDMRS